MQGWTCPCRGVLLASLGAFAAGCGGGGSGTTPPPSNPAPVTYTVGGSVSGMRGVGLTLKLNGGTPLTVATSGTFTFPDQNPDGASYTVTVGTQPATPRQVCSVAGGSGSIAAANASSVQVTCIDVFTVGGAVSGLASGSVALSLNGGPSLVQTANGSFVFSATLLTGAAFNVTVAAQPAGVTGLLCAVRSGSGSIAAVDVTAVVVDCHPGIGRFLYTDIESSGFVGGVTFPLGIMGYAIAPDTGVLTPVPGAPFATPRFGEKYLLADLQDKFLYFSPPSAGDPAEANLVSGMSIDAATGTLVALPPFSGTSTTNSFLTQPQWDQSGEYFLMGDTRGSFLSVLPALHVMRLNRASGVLSPINGSPFPTDAAVVGSQDPEPFVSRSGPWVYRSQGDFWVQTYGLDPAAGTLQFTAKISAPLTPFRSELLGKVLASTTDGRLLLASNGQRIFALRADPVDGRLSIINSVLPDPSQGCGVSAIHIHPNGRRVFVLMGGGVDERALPTIVPCPSRAQLYRLDPATGEMVLLDSKAATGSATIIGPHSAVHPGGQYLYFHSRTDVSYITSLDGIRYDAGTDTISLLGIVQAYPFSYPPGMGNINFLQMDPSGKFLFLGTGNGVVTFRIDESTGQFLARPSVAGAPPAFHGAIVGRQ